MNLRPAGTVSWGGNPEPGRSTDLRSPTERPLATLVPSAGRAAERAGPPDGDLVARLQADDLDAFEMLFERYRPLITRTAAGLTGDPGAAEEIVQDTFLRAYRHRATLRRDASLAPWLHRVALNLCYSRLSRHRLPLEPIGASAEGLRDATLGPAARAELEELRSEIRAGVAALAPGQRSVVVLYYLHDLSLAETAAFLGIRLGTVKSRLHYALRRLRDDLLARERSAGRPAPAGLPDERLLATSLEPADRAGDR